MNMPVTPNTVMALPTLLTMDKCASYEDTIVPFIYQFWDLPQRLLAVKSTDSLVSVYTSTNPAISGFATSLVVAVIAFIVSSVNKNYSQIDRVWSILPTFYNCHYWLWAYLNGIRAQRLDLLTIFSLCWSARLTFNYWRKGGYERGSEDYRWEIIKSYSPEVVWVIFNIVFISLIQSVLLWAVASPTYILLLVSRMEPDLTAADALFAQLLGACLITEFFADNQQWDYQYAKKQYQRTAKAPVGYTSAELERGFITSGLWKYSRHPNFAAEQAIWISLYQWGCFQTNSLMNWTFAGMISYVLIFQGSTPITEWISGKKYPQYKEYQARVGKFLPKLVGSKSWADYEAQVEAGTVKAPAAGGKGKKAQ